MRRLFLSIMTCLFICSCTSYRPSYSDPIASEINPKLHRLYIIHSDETVEKYNVLEKELEKNIFENSTNNFYGSIEMRLIKDDSKHNYAWLLSYVCIPLLPPIYSYTYAPEYDIIIYDIYDNIVANYTISSCKKRYRGLFYGDPDKLRIDVLKDIMSQLRLFLQRDAVKINEALKYAKDSSNEFEYQSFLKSKTNIRHNRKQKLDKDKEYRRERINQQIYSMGNAMQGFGNQLKIQNESLNNNRLYKSNRSRQQIMADIKKHEGYKKDYERYLNEENAKLNEKYGSRYSPTRANMWNIKINEVTKKLQELQNELRNATH